MLFVLSGMLLGVIEQVLSNGFLSLSGTNVPSLLIHPHSENCTHFWVWDIINQAAMPILQIPYCDHPYLLFQCWQIE